MAAVGTTRPGTGGRWRRLRGLVGFFTGTWEARIGGSLLLIYVVMAVFGSLLAPYPPTEIGVALPNEGPSAAHLLGTDGLGRDTFSRILAGAASVIAVPLVATVLAFVAGGIFGIACGYLGGRFDALGNRLLEVLLALPPLLVVLVVIASFGTSPPVIIISVMLVFSPRVARVLRGAALGVATKEYIQAAQARGERRLPILLREILPNISSVVLVEFAVRLTYAIIFVATLNFLGLGVQPPSPNWGAMLFESRVTIVTNPVATIAPTIAIGALAVAIGLVADAASRRFGLDEASEIIR